jgi:MFS family permease
MRAEGNKGAPERANAPAEHSTGSGVTTIQQRNGWTPMRRLQVQSPFAKLYAEAGLLPEIRRSLLFMIFGNLFGNLFGTVTSSSALTGLARDLGANDFIFGVLTAIPLFGSLMQLPAALLVSRTKKRKTYMLTYGLVSRALWILVGFVPFVIPVQAGWLRIWSLIFIVGLSSLGGSFINVCFTPWLADLVPISIRGRWLSARDRIISVIAVGVGLLTARLLDVMPGFEGYRLVFALGGIFGVFDMLCFIGVKNVPMHTSGGTKAKTVFRQMITDKPFFQFLLFWTLWAFTSNLAGPFIVRYALGPLELSFLQVTLASQVTAAVATMLVISRWGHLMDRFGNKPVMWISSLVTALTPLIMLFSAKGSPVTLFLFHAIGASFWCATNMGAMNTLLGISPDNQRPTYVALFSAITSIAGAFLGVLSGGAILQGIQDTVAANNITIGGWVPDHYAIVFVLAVIARLAVVVFFVPKLTNDKDYTYLDMQRAILMKFTGKRPTLMRWSSPEKRATRTKKPR